MPSPEVNKETPGIYVFSLAIYIDRKGVIDVSQVSNASFPLAVESLLSTAGRYASAQFAVTEYSCSVSGEYRKHVFNVENKGFGTPRQFFIFESLSARNYRDQLGNMVRACFEEGSNEDGENILGLLQDDNFLNELTHIDAVGVFHPLIADPGP